MDQFDLATGIAQQLMKDVEVDIDGPAAPLGDFVSHTKRQASGPEWITLSGLRSLVTTTLLGRSGITASACPVSVRDLPQDLDADETIKQVLGIITVILTSMTGEFAARTLALS